MWGDGVMSPQGYCGLLFMGDLRFQFAEVSFSIIQF